MKFLKLLVTLGVLDSLYLTVSHFSNFGVYCGTDASSCNPVLSSSYSELFGIPLSFIGLVHYIFLAVAIFSYSKDLGKYWAILFSKIGFVFSMYLTYLQLFVIGSICIYCVMSALVSTLVFILLSRKKEGTREALVYFSGFFYRNLFKPILFLIDAEKVHNTTISLGELVGDLPILKRIFGFLYKKEDALLSQTIEGIRFKNPIGLAAGFDYEARLTQFLPFLGFGFETVGTITNKSYGGNPKPRLGRLSKSKSLLVNKGFKSSGAKKVSNKLSVLRFLYPLGISIGRTNSPKLKTQKQSVNDIVEAFETFEYRGIDNSYYELNISCPNLIYGKNINFYSTKNLRELVEKVNLLKIKKPIFVKMPIDKANKETLDMLKVLAKYKCIKGVIFGNLQKDRSDKSFVKEEISSAGSGNFSGKPTWERSNELIKLAFKKYKNRFVIIGCGGVFSGKDAYEKIKNGASLVQLITGLVFEGPQLISEINRDLLKLIKKDGYKNISEAIGTSVK